MTGSRSFALSSTFHDRRRFQHHVDLLLGHCHFSPFRSRTELPVQSSPWNLPEFQYNKNQDYSAAPSLQRHGRANESHPSATSCNVFKVSSGQRGLFSSLFLIRIAVSHFTLQAIYTPDLLLFGWDLVGCVIWLLSRQPKLPLGSMTLMTALREHLEQVQTFTRRTSQPLWIAWKHTTISMSMLKRFVPVTKRVCATLGAQKDVTLNYNEIMRNKNDYNHWRRKTTQMKNQPGVNTPLNLIIAISHCGPV